MSSENPNMEEVAEARRESIAASIHTITIDELKALGEQLFPYIDHPWREKFFTFVSENTGATFYHAMTQDRFHILYCPSKQKGMWFLMGSGMGPLQARGLKVLKEIVDGL